MQFPAFVPVEVRNMVRRFLYGSSEPNGEKPFEWAGFEGDLIAAEKNLAWINQQISSELNGSNDEWWLLSLREGRSDATIHRDRLVHRIARIKRLATDGRMAEVFARLTPEIAADERWCLFIKLAWQADVDYEKIRDKLREARSLAKTIETAAHDLAIALRALGNIGLASNIPHELVFVRDLLRATEHGMRAGDADMWDELRAHLLGDPMPEKSRVGAALLDFPALPVQTEEDRARLRKVWNCSPEVASLLDAVGAAARGFEPVGEPFVEAGIRSRQRSVKTQYLRALGRLLIDARFPMTVAMKHSMAIVANVTLNSPEVDVSYDDVRQVIAKLGGDPLEKSAQNQ
jgi:hypothetical protein